MSDAPAQRLDPASVLFVTLDSCRYDTFEAAATPVLKGIGPLHRASAPGNYTYASHAAMFVGFTPGIAGLSEPYVNPKFGRIFRLAAGGRAGEHAPFFTLSGRDIIAGFNHLGYTTVGSGAVGWFDPSTAVSRNLIRSFDTFYYPGDYFSFRAQRNFILRETDRRRSSGPVFAFLNVGETHVPYWHQGADWDAGYNPCRPFSPDKNDADECRRRQLRCLEWVDREIEPLIRAFDGANIVVCADHGDAWGEDGVWEHGVHHPKVMEVPLVYRLTTGAPPSGRAAELRQRAEVSVRKASALVQRRRLEHRSQSD